MAKNKNNKKLAKQEIDRANKIKREEFLERVVNMSSLELLIYNFGDSYSYLTDSEIKHTVANYHRNSMFFSEVVEAVKYTEVRGKLIIDNNPLGRLISLLLTPFLMGITAFKFTAQLCDIFCNVIIQLCCRFIDLFDRKTVEKPQLSTDIKPKKPESDSSILLKGEPSNFHKP